MAQVSQFLIIGHGSESDGYTSRLIVNGTEEQAKDRLWRMIEDSRKELEAEYGYELDYGTESVENLQYPGCGCSATDAIYYGYSVYPDFHIDFMLYRINEIEVIDYVKGGEKV